MCCRIGQQKDMSPALSDSKDHAKVSLKIMPVPPTDIENKLMVTRGNIGEGGEVLLWDYMTSCV